MNYNVNYYQHKEPTFFVHKLWYHALFYRFTVLMHMTCQNRRSYAVPGIGNTHTRCCTLAVKILPVTSTLNDGCWKVLSWQKALKTEHD